MGRLEILTIPEPCAADWSAMRGDEKVRHCPECHLDVYNLSAMTTEEAERVVSEREGHVCVRFWKRHDGTVITQDCEPYRAEPRPCTPRPAAARTVHHDSQRAAAPKVQPPLAEPRPPVMMMGAPPPPPPMPAVLESAAEFVTHDTALVEISRAIRASSSETAEDLVRAIEKLLASHDVGGTAIACDKGQNAACPRCKGALWIPPPPADVTKPVNPSMETLDARKKLIKEVEPWIKASFAADRADRLLRELRRLGWGTGTSFWRSSCPHCSGWIGAPSAESTEAVRAD